MSQRFRGSAVPYIMDNYGTCTRGSSGQVCQCLQPGSIWLGTTCLHWRPVMGEQLAALKRMLETDVP